MRDNLQIIRDHYAAGAAGNLDGMIADFAPDIEWQSVAPVQRSLKGPASIVQNIFSTFPDTYQSFRVDIDRLYPAGDTVFMVGHYAGRNKQGRDFRVRVCHKWTLAGGKVVQYEQFADSAAMQAAIGG
jgi:ketosteroid isomerase-like protein